MSVNFDYYKIFYHVAKCSSISSAAKQLYLSQPTVSYSISNLEKELGCTLFIRTKKGVIMTPEAEMLYKHVAKACEHIFQAEEEIREVKNLRKGIVRIGASIVTLNHYLLPFLEEFRDEYPQIHLKISNFTTPSAIRALKSNLIDFAIVVLNATSSLDTLAVTALSDLQDIVIAGEKYAFLKNQELSLQDLNDYPLICMEQGTSTRKYLDEIFLSSGISLVPDIELATTDLILPMVERNLGIGLIPETFAKDGLDEGKVFQVHLKEKLDTRKICLIYNPDYPLSLSAHEFIEKIKSV